MKKKQNKEGYKAKALFEAKKRFHKEMAKLPFEEKIEILVRLQEIAYEIIPIKAKKHCRVWKI